MENGREIMFRSESADLSARLFRPMDAKFMVVLGHGSGSTNEVPFISGLAKSLAAEKCATFCFNYPYSQAPDFVPFTDLPVDADEVLMATIIAAIASARVEAPDLDLVFAGHSLSGFMAAKADATEKLAVKALVSLAYPLKGEVSHGAHLTNLATPLMIIQGTEDTLGTVSDITELVDGLAGKAIVKWIENASHTFADAGRSPTDIYAEIANHIRAFSED